MTLRRKMVYQIAGMIVALVMISGASLWGISGLHHDFGSAIQGYRQLRELYEARAHVTTARTLVTLSRHAEAPARAELLRARERFDAYFARNGGPAAQRYAPAIRSGIQKGFAELELLSAQPQRYDPAALAAPLSRVVAEVETLAAEIQGAISKSQADADRKLRTTLIVMSVLSACAIAGSILVGVSQYRSVMGPLRRLGAGVRRVAGGKFSERLEPAGPAEFVALGADFNRMAGELEGLYRDLERKVAEQSRELVQSERLASVGYLAAGVAHEINNPIGIIAGYAELTLQELRKQGGNLANCDAAEVEKTLRVIAEEAFRCKQIVERLLSLARPGDEQRQMVSLGDVAANVISTVQGLGEYKDRRLTLRADPARDLDVLASEGEMKQVVLNLTLNALEAARDNAGEVRVDVVRQGGHIELSVADGGKGMPPDVLERVFEPFFTAKRGSTRPGTGLGLSISHAIVRQHGGRIVAESAGPGKGSRFLVQLPAARQEEGKP